MKNRIVVYWNEKIRSYDLKISYPWVTVGDYEQAFVHFSFKKRYRASCLGCALCCQGRIPLTLIDIYRMINGGVGHGLSVEEWVLRFAHIEFIGNCADIVLKLDADGFCSFLDPKSLTCTIYESRPLVCSTYFCCRFSKESRHLRSRIINLGEDELVRYLLSRDISKYDPRWNRLNPHDWKPNCFTGKTSYQQVSIREVCGSSLWQAFVRKSRLN
ncbi:MAG: hypothetical protein XD63_0413 [Thermoanaerobacterales bacterium 50_218]|nr:MAG: hypothetical protein XD63_0413 [Thermoanaerobacterales bacterium 50_218]